MSDKFDEMAENLVLASRQKAVSAVGLKEKIAQALRLAVAAEREANAQLNKDTVKLMRVFKTNHCRERCMDKPKGHTTLCVRLHNLLMRYKVSRQ